MDKKFIWTLFISALLVPLLAFAVGVGSLQTRVDYLENNLKDHYVTNVELEKLNGGLRELKVILEHTPWYTESVERKVKLIQGQTNERIRQQSIGYISSQKKDSGAR